MPSRERCCWEHSCPPPWGSSFLGLAGVKRPCFRGTRTVHTKRGAVCGGVPRHRPALVLHCTALVLHVSCNRPTRVHPANPALIDLHSCNILQRQREMIDGESVRTVCNCRIVLQNTVASSEERPSAEIESSRLLRPSLSSSRSPPLPRACYGACSQHLSHRSPSPLRYTALITSLTAPCDAPSGVPGAQVTTLLQKLMEQRSCYLVGKLLSDMRPSSVG